MTASSRFKVPFFLHDLGQEEIDAVTEAIRHPVLTTGETVARFEARLAEYLGCRHILATTSCTGALHISLLALDIGPGDEVITTPMTFIATASSILEAGATPVFVDVEPDTGNLDIRCVEAAITERTRAILPVHLYGRLCDMVALRELARQRGLHLIEDAAHCLEGRLGEVRPATLGDTACFSFYATKNITCGEGGALAVNDEDLYARLRLLRLHGMTKSGAERASKGYEHWDMVLMGWKYNMSNIDAALLLPQMDRVERNLARREVLAQRYEFLLGDLPGVRLFAPPAPGTRHARHLFPILVEGKPRDIWIAALHAAGISVMVNYRPVHLTRYFSERYGFAPGMFPVAEWIGDRVISLPLYPRMQESAVDLVVDALRRIAAA
ncbi:MAG: DegT/DnrJ/EryC1/StrS family aminotransferase [Magnetococcales bacterium]|nr:DegT/DnrJ/EryC1/StrS family aminotransferase [Magnetococcales bacterium]